MLLSTNAGMSEHVAVLQFDSPVNAQGVPGQGIGFRRLREHLRSGVLPSTVAVLPASDGSTGPSELEATHTTVEERPAPRKRLRVESVDSADEFEDIHADDDKVWR